MFKKSFSRNHSRGRFMHGVPRKGGQTTGQIQAVRYVNKSIDPVEVVEYVSTHKFSDFAIDETLKRTVAAHGYEVPTPIQDQTIPSILEGKDVVGIANTGTGKTAAFLLPLINKILINRSEKALIMVPTRELAVQVEDELKAFSKGMGIYSVVCIGGSNMNAQIAMIRKNPNILIATPGRLKDFLERRIVRLDNVHTIILDEVDRMVDIGFIQDIRNIMALLPKDRQSLFFSATITPEVDGIIRSFSQNPITVSVKKEETARSVDQDIIRVNSNDEKVEVLHEMLKKEEFTKVLIFGRTKFGVEKLSRKLEQRGFTVASIHGNKSQGQRLRALSQFKSNQLQILVATDIAARGLDIEDVSHVINFDEPSTYTDYVHRIGRTGRANKAGKAFTFIM